jgi:hypothetical protein
MSLKIVESVDWSVFARFTQVKSDGFLLWYFAVVIAWPACAVFLIPLLAFRVNQETGASLDLKHDVLGYLAYNRTD